MALKFLSCALFAAFVAVGCGDDSTSGGGGTGGATGGAGGEGGQGGDGGAGGSGVQCDVCADYGAAVPAAVDEIVNRAAADPQFEADFAPLVMAGDAAVTAFKASLTAFVSDAYGCTTGTYEGPSMVEAHTGLDITQEEYDAFVGLIAGVLSDAGVPDDYIGECFAPALTDPTFAADLIGK